MTTMERTNEVKLFDQTKRGVKGLVDAGVTKAPSIFHTSFENLKNPKPLSIPILDLEGGVLESPVMRKRVVEKVKDASEKFGFFQVINHGIPVDVMERMKDGIRAFHEQDPEIKQKYYSRIYSQKIKFNSNGDIYESPAASWRDTLSCILAPEAPPSEDLPEICRDIMLEYSNKMMKFGELIFELLSESLGLSPDHLKNMDCTEGLWNLCHYYPPCPEPDRTLGAAQHTDRSFLTVLLQDHVGGLQVLHDGYWIDVPPTPGALIINIGDFLQILTNDKYTSVEHRVLTNGGQQRVSIGSFFVHPPPHSKLYGPIKELLSEENPPKYRETTAEASNHFVARKVGENASLSHLRI